jgi:hypothetical protein
MAMYVNMNITITLNILHLFIIETRNYLGTLDTYSCRNILGGETCRRLS